LSGEYFHYIQISGFSARIAFATKQILLKRRTIEYSISAAGCETQKYPPGLRVGTRNKGVLFEAVRKQRI